MTDFKDSLKTFEEYLLHHKEKACDFRIRVDFTKEKPSFYIHPLDVDGETLDYSVDGNFLNCNTPG